MRSLDETSGTGPDLLPARVLKNCDAELASSDYFAGTQATERALLAKVLAQTLGPWYPQAGAKRAGQELPRHTPHTAILKNCRTGDCIIDVSSASMYRSLWTPSICVRNTPRLQRCVAGKHLFMAATHGARSCGWSLLLGRSGAFDRVSRTRLAKSSKLVVCTRTQWASSQVGLRTARCKSC